MLVTRYVDLYKAVEANEPKIVMQGEALLTYYDIKHTIFKDTAKGAAIGLLFGGVGAIPGAMLGKAKGSLEMDCVKGSASKFLSMVKKNYKEVPVTKEILKLEHK